MEACCGSGGRRARGRLNLPRHADIWLPGYVRSRLRQWTFGAGAPQRVWLSIADHFEPLGGRVDDETARGRVQQWARQWPAIAARYRDSANRSPKYTFFYPQEEYRPHLLGPLASMADSDIADVE